jgi:hypothetical protein
MNDTLYGRFCSWFVRLLPDRVLFEATCLWHARRESASPIKVYKVQGLDQSAVVTEDS